MADQYDVQAEGKKKPAHGFTTPQDVDLIKEVMSICPHDAPYGQTSARWAEVGEHMRTIHVDSLSATGCRKRCDDLLVAFQKAMLASLRASGTDEEYDEREQLLQDLSDMKATKEDKCKKMDKRESDGHTVRSAALTGMKRKSLGDEGDDNDSDEAKKTMMKKERRSSAIMKESVNAVMSFTSIMENTNKFKIDELAFQKESNAIAMRKLELDEKRYLLDKAEREARFALEQQERQGQMDFMRGLLK
ncbi:hypothetical protein, variant [Aphanomyces astaci]|uniref:Uncharacterized protein n=1 Tax=Aphanomyces astaci TaxID=112090 RepID=W4FN17_APHAT|nr:hypothetical protein, variant [Aphanomyces astaci]ETV68870.1 hypothetical protein, variant [Aphanomyces astaci]|eukprot:XP_009841546.1 hypothetical protein, variant [Aphanomyces astaci]